MDAIERKITETPLPGSGAVAVRWLLIGPRGWVELKTFRFDHPQIGKEAEFPALAAGADRVWLPVDIWCHSLKEWDRLPSPGDLLACDVTGGPCDHHALPPDEARSLAARWPGDFDDEVIWGQLAHIYSGIS